MRKYISLILFIGLLFWSCEEENECDSQTGCIDSNAVNFSQSAIQPDSSCEYSVYGFPNFEAIIILSEAGDVLGATDNGIFRACIEDLQVLGTNESIENNFSTFPNPSISGFNVQFNLSVQNNVEIYILNKNYDNIVTLFNDVLNAGVHNIQCNPENIPSDFYRLVIDFGDIECFQNIQLKND